MKDKLKPRIPFEIPETKTIVMVALLVLAPLLLNLVLWKTLAHPAETRARSLKDLQALLRIKPKFESLLLESDVLLNRADEFDKKGDPTRMIKQIQEKAREFHIQINEVRLKDADRQMGAAPASKGPASFEEVVVALEVQGNYHKLGRWIHALESRPDLRVESFSLRPSEANRKTNALSLQLGIFMRNS